MVVVVVCLPFLGRFLGVNVIEVEVLEEVCIGF
jgi:hypothetical protein